MAANSRFAVATHIMASLATKPSEDWISSSYLAGSVNTNPVVIRRILSDLQKAGLIETQSGKNGGARLAKEAKAITLHHVYAAVEDGSIFAFNANDPNLRCSLSCKMKSLLEPVFQSADKAVEKELKKFRLSQLKENAGS